MEVRCGNCNKLFRVSDDKISGKGVKFACTRCGKYVKITIEDFSNYTRSKTTGPAADLLVQKLKPTISEIGQTALPTAAGDTISQSMAPDKAGIEPALQTTIGQEFLKADIPLQEKKEPATLDRFPFEMPDYQAGALPERGLEFPVQTVSQNEKPDITQSETEEMHEPQMEADAVAMRVEMPRAESGTAPVGAIREDIPPVSELQPEQSTETETAPMQAVIAEPGIAAAGENDTAPFADGPKSQSETESQITRYDELVEAFEIKPATAKEAGETETAQPEATQPLEFPLETITEKTGEAAKVPEPEPEATYAAIPTVMAQPDIRREIKQVEIPEARHQSTQNIPWPKAASQPMNRSKPAAFSDAQTERKEHPYHASPAPSPVIGASSNESPRSGSRSMIVVVSFIILILVGLGVYMYMRTTEPSSKTAATHMVSTEGMHILNASGSFEPNTDLVVSGVVENLTDKPQSAWLVVVDVYDAKGTVINKIKLLNGKQLYTQRDYDILAKRGANVQELKAKAIQEDGTIIQPKDKVTFEIRYLEPPAGIASFTATLQPFDPARLSKEVEDQAK